MSDAEHHRDWLQAHPTVTLQIVAVLTALLLAAVFLAVSPIVALCRLTAALRAPQNRNHLAPTIHDHVHCPPPAR